ncbi:MAG TPA: isoaspartyl peptidase/L-asparaginase [Ktedonosporobacter sp.]|jgi:beta-aspartyl-peptidase (threonine type)|nr:isoaspartyl peptidase/L-asparaginase [Ktedonosporobacter sp.]
MPIAIVVHGGAGDIAPERRELAVAGCKEAARVGWRILQAGGTALDAVEAAVQLLEDNPNYNAGTGSCLTRDGNIEMDAGMMEGHTFRVGAVAGVELIKNPIILARKVLESPHVLLIGKGAQEFALEQGLSLCKFEDLLTERQYNNWKKLHGIADDEPRYLRREMGSRTLESADDEPGSIAGETEKKHGTVGAVAIDMSDNLAAATSTGGFLNKYPGRVGDSPLIGCGFYADEHAAVSCTGYGEDFMRLLIARRAAECVAGGSNAREAAQAAIAILSAKATGTGGLITVDRIGNVGFAWNSKNMARAYLCGEMQEPEAGI